MNIMQVQRETEGCVTKISNMTAAAGRETIHSGQFMVSHFEAEEQDDDEHSVPIPESVNVVLIEGSKPKSSSTSSIGDKSSPQIDSSLAKLFQCMSLAYRQKLTSPKWNRFKGIRLRWKDKIRLNNVIWRCWHMQFISKQNSLVCQFASPLDVDTHNKPEAVVLEGKYWKRKLAAVTAEYKKWRMFSRNRVLGYGTKDTTDLPDIEFMEFVEPTMLVDDDYMQFMSDTLFSTISNQAFAFPDSREIARGAGLADFIQPSLGPLQPNLDDYMDTLQPFQDLLEAKLTPVPEEITMDTSLNNNETGINSAYYGMIAVEPLSYDISNYITDASSTVQSRASTVRTKSSKNDLVAASDTHSYSQINYMYTMPNTTIQTTLQNQSMIVNQAHTNMDIQTNNLAALSSLNNIESNFNANNLTLQSNTPKNKKSDYTKQTHAVNVRQNAPKKASDIINTKNCTKFIQNDISAQCRSGFHDKSDATSNILATSPNNVPFFRNISNQQNYKIPANRDQEHSRVSKNEKVSKEMYRSNSLPLNSSLNLQDMFLIPTSSNKSNATQHNSAVKLPPLHSAISDPALNQNNALAHLLTGNKSPISSILGSSNVQANQKFADQIGLLVNTIANTNQLLPSHSPQSSESAPLSPDGSISPVGLNTRGPPREVRRAGHIHAEQKRRYNIKNGFDILHSLIPHLQHNPTNKFSKAAMLQKGAEYIRQLQIERKLVEDEIMSLKNQAETLNASISNCQSMLPATGAPVSRQRTGRIREMFREYVYARTLEDWKFWIFSLLVEPLLLTFNSSVSTATMQELCRTTIQWVDQHCSLVDLRPGVLNALRLVCTATDILSEPERLPEQARNAVINQQQF